MFSTSDLGITYPSLFHRIESEVGNLAPVSEALCSALSELLSAREGSIPARPDYGLPDVSDLLMEWPISGHRLALIIAEKIRCFESRLSGIRVYSVSSSLGSSRLGLAFRIDGTLNISNISAEPVSLTAFFRPGGVVEVGR